MWDCVWEFSSWFLPTWLSQTILRCTKQPAGLKQLYTSKFTLWSLRKLLCSQNDKNHTVHTLSYSTDRDTFRKTCSTADTHWSLEANKQCLLFNLTYLVVVHALQLHLFHVGGGERHVVVYHLRRQRAWPVILWKGQDRREEETRKGKKICRWK